MSYSELNCPKCSTPMDIAFCNRNSGLSYTKLVSFKKKIFKDEDLFESGFRQFIPWKARWHKSHICESCAVYVIEYDHVFEHADIKKYLEAIGDKIA